MKKWAFPILLLFVLNTTAQRVELGVQAGKCNYWGDLTPTFTTQERHTTGGIFARINFNHTWALKIEINRFVISGNDSNFQANKLRNLSFQTTVNEISTVLEFNYIKYGTHVLHDNFTSYVYLGVGAFNYNPQAYLRGTWHDLRDYRTENVEYKKYSFSIPFGIGVKYMFNNKYAFESQIGFRKTFTDYLDDVSTVYPDITSRFTDGGLIGATLTDRSIETFGMPQYKDGYKRGDPGHKDWIMSMTIGFTMRLHSRSKCARFF